MIHVIDVISPKYYVMIVTSCCFNVLLYTHVVHMRTHVYHIYNHTYPHIYFVIHTQACVHVHMHLHVRMRMYTYTSVDIRDTHTHAYKCVHLCIKRTLTCINIRKYAYIHVYIRTYMYTILHTHKPAYIPLKCVHVNTNVYEYIHVRRYT